MRKLTALIFALILPGIISMHLNAQGDQPKKVYMTYILHGNMNYDRYVKSRIWDEFPVIYNNLLNYLEEHPQYKGQLQLSGQTYESLKQVAPYVIENAEKLHKRGQINYTGTFYSEPVNVSIDGETNLRCMRLGTEIIARELGSTDGFYLQERAYHAQLPWILNETNVTWVPVKTGDDSFFPFKMSGMDGSTTICVPNITRGNFPGILEQAPPNSLLTIEGDYEIPQSFGVIFDRVNLYLEDHPEIEVEWITVKEYIEKFGVKEERFVDHTALARHINHGTYSRWTADPLDIIVQDYTNKAMNDFRAANMMNSLCRKLYDLNLDLPYTESDVSMIYDPLAWAIASTADYPEVEQTYLAREGIVTMLSKTEHLLVWAVNSDSRGWYPLYEKRRERINSLENCSLLSNDIINRGLESIAENLDVPGYDRTYILFNPRPARTEVVSFRSGIAYSGYLGDGTPLRSFCYAEGPEIITDVEVELPAYGYTVVALKEKQDEEKSGWGSGNEIRNDRISITADENTVAIDYEGRKLDLSLDDFKIRVLAEIVRGDQSEYTWRDAEQYGPTRIAVNTDGLYPRLRIDRQIDWLVHMQQVFTLLPDRVYFTTDFDFPHPTLVRETGKANSSNLSIFQPGGLNLRITAGEAGRVYYNIPYGSSPHLMDSLSYFCSLHSGILEAESGAGYILTGGTGEQAYFTNPLEGVLGVYMGASTASGPVKDAGLEIVSDIRVNHEESWYAEPFHGKYHHNFMLLPYSEGWREADAFTEASNFLNAPYVKEFIPSDKASGRDYEKSLLGVDGDGIEVTSMEYVDGVLELRLNERENKAVKTSVALGDMKKKIKMPANGIVTVKMD